MSAQGHETFGETAFVPGAQEIVMADAISPQSPRDDASQNDDRDNDMHDFDGDSAFGGDSAYGGDDMGSETVSLSSHIGRYRYENGRCVSRSVITTYTS